MSERPRDLVLLSLVFFFFQAALASDFDADRAKFTISYNGDVLPYEVMSVFVLPRETLVFELPDPPAEKYEIKVPEGMLVRLGREKWSWRAPQEKGLYRIKVANQALDESITINVFVMVPVHQLSGEYLNGYHIGKYPLTALKNNPIYRPPRGFVEVTKANRDTHISPHFKLKQFVSKQQSDYPMYVILQEKLLLKLELILESVNVLGHESDTLHIMSGYRTPFYNKAIGNVRYSLHQWGGAADIFVDDDENGLIDDLNKDRRIDLRDAHVLHRIIEVVQKDPQHRTLAGGWDSTQAQSPTDPLFMSMSEDTQPDGRDRLRKNTLPAGRNGDRSWVHLQSSSDGREPDRVLRLAAASVGCRFEISKSTIESHCKQSIEKHTVASQRQA